VTIIDLLKVDGSKKNPCWKGYEMVGTKQKNGRTVPNCVKKVGKSAAHITLGELMKVVDENGAKHGADGRFSAGSGAKASASESADAGTSYSSRPKPPDHLTDNDKEAWLGNAGGTGAIDNTVPSVALKIGAFDLKPKENVKMTGKWVLTSYGGGKLGDAPNTYNIGVHIRGVAKTYAVAQYDKTENTCNLTIGPSVRPEDMGAVLNKLVTETMGQHPGVKSFTFKDAGRNTRSFSASAQYANDRERLLKQHVFDSFFTDGVPNNMFGTPKKPKLAAKIEATEIADKQLFKSLNKEQTKIVTDTVAAELAACKFMPKTLAILTDAQVGGVKGGGNALAWACPTANGQGVVRIMPSREKWQRELKYPIQAQEDCFTVGGAMPPEKRISEAITHEMGHILDFAIEHAIANGNATVRDAYNLMWLEKSQASIGPDAAQMAKDMRLYPSRYGMKNRREWFAESYSAYRHGLKVPDAAKKFFDTIGVSAIEKMLSQFYLLDGSDGSDNVYDCDIMSDDAERDYKDWDVEKARRGAMMKMLHTTTTRVLAKYANAVRVGSAITVNPHLVDHVMRPADAGRVLATHLGDMGSKGVTYHSATTDKSESAPMSHVRRVATPEGDDKGNAHVSIVPLRIGDDEGEHIVVRHGVVRGRIEPTKAGDVTLHTVHHALGDAPKTFQTRADAITAIHARYTPREVRKLKDDDGHEHGSDGKFTSGSGGPKAGKVSSDRKSRAVFVVGPAGSGKGRVTDEMSKKYGIDNVINSDHIKETIPGYDPKDPSGPRSENIPESVRKGLDSFVAQHGYKDLKTFLRESPDDIGAGLHHIMSRAIALKKVHEALKDGKDFIFDAVGGARNHPKYVQSAIDKGMAVHVAHAWAPPEVTLKRNHERARSVPDHVVLGSYANSDGAAKNMKAVVDQAGSDDATYSEHKTYDKAELEDARAKGYTKTGRKDVAKTLGELVGL
jgi:predicted ABC-type ATPase